MANVEIYTWSTCPFCRRAKHLLDQKGVNYTEYTIDAMKKLGIAWWHEAPTVAVLCPKSLSMTNTLAAATIYTRWSRAASWIYC